MCGIAAIFAYKNNTDGVDRQELRRIRDYMTLRGPDGYGEWYSADNRVGLGHRRLAIIDLSENGAQPMVSSDGRLVVSFNGEIYNYQTLRSDLEGKGRHFSSSSDTEVLLHLYEEKGPDMLNDLRGMFAFVIWDKLKKELFIARDPFGIKPLYYSDDGSTLRVASQVKALLAGGRIDTSLEPAGHVGFFLWGHVPGPYTLYKGIRSLPAGTYMCVDQNGGTSLKTYSTVRGVLAEAEKSALELNKEKRHERLREALLDSVRHHLIADVPVGVFLSSGMDSSTLVALASEVKKSRLNTVTLGFREYIDTHDDETPLATLVADRCHTAHQTIWVSKDDFQSERDRMLKDMDQPTIDGVNSYFVSRAAVRTGLKVAVSGLGGDELFGSYSSFHDIPEMVKMFGPVGKVPFLGKAFRVISAPLLKHFTSPKYAGLFEYGGSYAGAYMLRRGMFMPWELPGLLDREMVKEGWNELQPLLRLDDTIKDIRSDYLKVSALEMCWYMRNQLLQDTDWASMAHSLEVRVPLVDINLLHSLSPLLSSPSRPTKRDMASTPRDPLPYEIINRAKTGFSVPVRQWLMGDAETSGERGLRGWAKKIYSSEFGPSMKRKGIVQCSNKNVLSFESERIRKEESDKGEISLGPSFRVLNLVTDAFGGHGGIAKFNRDFMTVLCNHPRCKEVVTIPRLMPNPTGPLPAKLKYITKALNSKRKFIATVLKTVKAGEKPDLIVCGHMNLIPVAYVAKMLTGSPLLLIVHGIDAWQPTRSYLTNYMVKKIDAFIAVSKLTSNYFLRWAGLDKNVKSFILPNCVDINLYGPGPRNSTLLTRYGLKDRKVLMTMGRLVSKERYKGFDEILELLPELLREIPNLTYLIVGDGNDRKRLERKAASLRVEDHVVFTGFIDEKEKADHFRLADAYVMPSRGEGFGIVFLEAMACGVPVVASKIDGSREAVREGKLGILVDPINPEEIKSGIIRALDQPKGIVPEELEYFSFDSFTIRLHAIVENVLRGKGK